MKETVQTILKEIDAILSQTQKNENSFLNNRTSEKHYINQLVISKCQEHGITLQEFDNELLNLVD